MRETQPRRSDQPPTCDLRPHKAATLLIVELATSSSRELAEEIYT
jgi:hypothetical protein